MANLSIREVRKSLANLRLFPEWSLADEVLKQVASRVSDTAIPVVVTGSASYECDHRGLMLAACNILGRILRELPNVALLTGGMPAVGRDVGAAFCAAGGIDDRLFHLLPKNHGLVNPDTGEVLISGASFE